MLPSGIQTGPSGNWSPEAISRTFAMRLPPEKLFSCAARAAIRRGSTSPAPAGGYHETATENTNMTSAKRNNQLQIDDVLMLLAVGITILGGLYTLLA
jgi:hypothetical protein